MGANDNSGLSGDFSERPANLSSGKQAGQDDPATQSGDPQGKTILVAAIPASAEVVVEALSGVAPLIVVHSLPRALHLIAHGVDLIIAGTYFDGSRMFDLLRAVKDDPAMRDIPFICVRAIAAPTSPEAAVRQPIFTNQDVVDSACRALGAVAFVDLCEQPPARSTAEAKVALARLARACLAGRGANIRPA
jgi:CheY-like chemotaxis protein